jgi:hypothetical protein
MRQPSGMRTHVWLWRLVPWNPGRLYSALAVAKFSPKVVISVRPRVRSMPLMLRPWPNAEIAACP